MRKGQSTCRALCLLALAGALTLFPTGARAFYDYDDEDGPPPLYAKLCQGVGPGYFLLPGSNICVDPGPQNTFTWQPAPTGSFYPATPAQASGCSTLFGQNSYSLPSRKYGWNNCITLNYNFPGFLTRSGTYTINRLPRDWRQQVAARTQVQPAATVRYDSPTFAGFTLRGTVDEDYWNASLRQAGEFAGFRIAAGVAYANVNGDTAYEGTGFTASGSSSGVCADIYGETPLVIDRRSGWFLSGGFAAGICSNFNYGTINPNNLQDHRTHIDALANAGVRFSLNRNFIQSSIAPQPAPASFFDVRSLSFYAEFGLAGADLKITSGGTLAADYCETGTYWGIGASVTVGSPFQQALERSALELYAAWRHIDLGTVSTSFGVPAKTDFDMILAGARIKY